MFDFSGNFAECFLVAEIRGHFAALPADQRMALLTKRIEAKDITTLRALGAGPDFLAGLPPDRHDFVRNALIDMVPEAAAARDPAKTLAEQEKVVAQVESEVLQGTANLIDIQQAESYERVASAAVAAA